jgi:hypothetical protein
VPGKNPSEAAREYLTPLQQSLSCMSNDVIRPSSYDPNVLLTATLSDISVELMTDQEEILYLSFVQHFSIIEPAVRLFRYKVKTRAYYYGLENAAHKEILMFHWHPETTPENAFPHFHIGSGAGDFRPEIGDIHFPTSRIAFEEFCLLLINEFGVIPERSDAKIVLERNLSQFKKHRSWGLTLLGHESAV